MTWGAVGGGRQIVRLPAAGNPDSCPESARSCAHDKIRMICFVSVARLTARQSQVFRGHEHRVAPCMRQYREHICALFIADDPSMQETSKHDDDACG